MLIDTLLCIDADRVNNFPDLSQSSNIVSRMLHPNISLFRGGCATEVLQEKLVGLKTTHPHSHQTSITL